MERAVCKSFFRSHFISFFPCFCKSFSLSLSLSLSSSCSLPTSSQLLDEPNANTPILILMLAFHHFSTTTLLHQLTICDPCPNIYLFSYPFFLSLSFNLPYSPVASLNLLKPTTPVCSILSCYTTIRSIRSSRTLCYCSLYPYKPIPTLPLALLTPPLPSLFFPYSTSTAYEIGFFFFFLQHTYFYSSHSYGTRSVHLCPCLCLLSLLNVI